MLARARDPADLERCRRQPLPEEETEADDDAAEAVHVQPAQPCARPYVWGLSPRRWAALAVLAGAAAVVAWGRAKASPLLPRWRERAVGLLRAECTEWSENCSASRCCADPNLTCFEKDETWAACIEDCEPGIHKDWDEVGYRTNWSCRPLTRLGAGGAYDDSEGTAVEAEAASWTTGGTPTSCEDLVDGWQDATGRSCQDYAQDQLCTATGDFGPGWNGPGGLPVPGVSVLGHGLSAAEACCACGGGSAKRSMWILAHRDWNCRGDAGMLADKQAPDKLRLSECEKFCFSYHHMEFRTSEPAGICRCHSECPADGQKTHLHYHNLVYMRAISV